jgi:hypothetical protein
VFTYEFRCTIITPLKQTTEARDTMPQFSYHAPATQSDLANSRFLAKLQQSDFPVGLIGSKDGFSWGYDGSSYYVAEGVFEFLVTKMKLSLDQAKQLFNALNFINAIEPSPKAISRAIKLARKKLLLGDDLMWFFIEELDSLYD